MSWPGYIAEAVSRALAEDLGGRGDITSQATIAEDRHARVEIRSRAAGVLAGAAAANESFAQIDAAIRIDWQAEDGDPVAANAVVAEIHGPARSILTAERTALNFLGRLSGIASLTRAYVDAVSGTATCITHTRKTTPGLRALELAAVRSGGGVAHRFGLDDGILIKDNHVALCGGVAAAIQRAQVQAGHMTRVAVEIDRLDQLQAAIAAGADSVLLDNFSLIDLTRAVEQADGVLVLEASGSVTLDTVHAIAETGVDVISVGAITHSAPNFDFGLDAVESQ
ncbi:MAG: carboxylating nicotinate-nucleotide diphosphorylase [Pseudomonadota bacterium]